MSVIRASQVVCVDARMVRGVPHGIGQYVYGLAKGMRELHALRALPYELIFLGDPDRSEKEIEGWPVIPSRYRFLSSPEILGVPHEVKMLGASLFVNPSFASFLGMRCPWIQVVHDLNHLHFGGRSKRLYYRTLLRRSLHHAEKVLTVSEFSRRELAQWLRWAPEKIGLLANPLWKNPTRASPVDQPQRPTGPYFFSLGNDKAHKNLGFFRDIFVKWRRQSPETMRWIWVVTHPDWHSPDEGIVGLSGLRSSAVEPWMNGASAVVCPSIYEGFGRVPLEALLAGSRVIASDIPAHREGLLNLESTRTRLVPLEASAWFACLDQWLERDIDWTKAQQSALDAKILDRYSPIKMAQSLHREIEAAL